MGGGDSGGSSTTTQYNIPVIPEELKPLFKQTAQNITSVQNQLPLGGSVSYSQQMLNPAYTQWQTQYGGYPTNYQDPNTFVINTPGMQAFSQAMAGRPGVTPVSGQGYYYDANGNPIYIPPAPPQYIPDPSSAVQQTPNFLSPQVQQIAPLTDLEQQAISMTPGLAQTPEAELLAMLYAQQAGQAPSSEQYWAPGAFEASPYYNTAYGAFQSGALPTIENQMALSGLGRSSSAADAIAQGWSQMLPTALSQYATQYVEPQMGREENALARMAGLVPSLGAIGTQDTARQLQAINAMFQGGGLQRTVEQSALDAMYADILRQQALAEEALFTPMGLLFPSSIGQMGSSSTSTSGKSGGGLFK